MLKKISSQYKTREKAMYIVSQERTVIIFVCDKEFMSKIDSIPYDIVNSIRDINYNLSFKYIFRD